MPFLPAGLVLKCAHWLEIGVIRYGRAILDWRTAGTVFFTGWTPRVPFQELDGGM